MLRLFVAVNLTENLRQQIWDSSATLRRAAPALLWSSPDHLHITLKFLGAQPAELVQQLSDSLSEVAAEHSPIRISMGQFGAFPNPARPRVVWLGITQGANDLSKLAHDVDHACVPFGTALESRPFRPHITLARSRDSLAENQRMALSVAMKHEVAFEPFVVESIDLMRSEMSPRGSRYTALAVSHLRDQG